MVQSFKDFDRWVVAATCVMLAGKVEETPKKCKDIIKVAHQLLTAEQVKAFGNDAKVWEIFKRFGNPKKISRLGFQLQHVTFK